MELRIKASTIGWFHLVIIWNCVRLKITNTEQMIPAMAQNIPSFNKEIDKQDKAAKTPKNKAKLVKSFPMLIFIFLLTH